MTKQTVEIDVPGWWEWIEAGYGATLMKCGPNAFSGEYKVWKEVKPGEDQ